MDFEPTKILTYYQDDVKSAYFGSCRDIESYADFNNEVNNKDFSKYVLDRYKSSGDPAFTNILEGKKLPEYKIIVDSVFSDFMANGEKCPDSSKLKQLQGSKKPVKQNTGPVEAETVQGNYAGETKVLNPGVFSQTEIVHLLVTPKPATGAPQAADTSQATSVYGQTGDGETEVFLPLVTIKKEPAANVDEQTKVFLPSATAEPPAPQAVGTPQHAATPQYKAIPIDIAAIGAKMGESIDEILSIFEKNKDVNELYKAWNLFKTQYLNAMYEIAERLSSSEDNKARREIVMLAGFAEGFAQHILDKTDSAFLKKLSVPKHALFMAQLSIINTIRRKTSQLGKSVDPNNNISSTLLNREIQNFRTAWDTINNPERYMNAVLSKMRTYISNKKGFWNWLTKSERLWRLENIKITGSGNTSSIDPDRKWQIYSAFDRLILEASGRNWSGLNVEIGFDGKNRSATIHSKNDSFDDLKNDKSFKEIIERLGGVWERPAWYARLFVVWRRWRIPFDAPDGSPSTSSSSPVSGSLLPGGTQQGSPSGKLSGSPSGTSHMWSEPITDTDEEIVATDDVTNATADGSTDPLVAGIMGFWGIPKSGLTPCGVLSP